MIISISRDEIEEVARAVGACDAPMRAWDRASANPRTILDVNSGRLTVELYDLDLSLNEIDWAERHLSAFAAPMGAQLLRARAFCVARMVVLAARSELSSPPREDDRDILRHLRVRRAKSWSAIARLVAAYGELRIPRPPYRESVGPLPLMRRWCTYARSWASYVYGLQKEWVVPTQPWDLRVREYDDRDSQHIELMIDRAPRSYAEIRAERAAKQAAYEERLDQAARQIGDGTIRLVSHWDVPRGYYRAQAGQEGGTLLVGEDDAVRAISLPGALRRAGISLFSGEAPIDALYRHLEHMVPGERSPRLRGMAGRVRRLPASDRARAVS